MKRHEFSNDAILHKSDLHGDVPSRRIRGMVDSTEGLFGGMSDGLACPVPGCAFDGRLKAAVVKRQVLGCSRTHVKSDDGQFMAAELG